ncbi:DUF3558 family protein [Amycolatopsis sp. cmx-4-61]|uniref:DUF3558 family protein n=1 Tax=Amycolatopsis sp. cmx-4-61 TaxID=2790937 RepID=UPI003978B08E
MHFRTPPVETHPSACGSRCRTSSNPTPAGAAGNVATATLPTVSSQAAFWCADASKLVRPALRPARRAHRWATADMVTETSIDGLPAIVYHQRGSTDDCSVAVQATDQQMLTFEITGKDLPRNYWADDRCGGVAKMAEAVIGNLRQN